MRQVTVRARRRRPLDDEPDPTITVRRVDTGADEVLQHIDAALTA